MIVAASLNGVIGRDQELPWHLPADLKYFKRLTLGRHILMGRKTFESIGKPLPGRVNMVLSRSAEPPTPGLIMISSLEEGILIAEEAGEEELFIIGGATVYELAYPYAQRIYLTRVETELDGNAHFHDPDEQWALQEDLLHPADEKHAYSFRFQRYERIAGSTQTLE